MNTLELDEISLRKGWGGEGEYWFSLQDYSINSDAKMSELDHPEDMSQSEYYVSLGYIPYFHLSSEEVIRAYVPTIERKKLRDKLVGYQGSEYVENFWKYFHIYPEISDPYIKFEQKYVIDKAVRWCEENGINYELKV